MKVLFSITGRQAWRNKNKQTDKLTKQPKPNKHELHFLVKFMDTWDCMNKTDLSVQLQEINKYKLIIDLKLKFLTVSSKSGLTQLLKKRKKKLPTNNYSKVEEIGKEKAKIHHPITEE